MHYPRIESAIGYLSKQYNYEAPLPQTTILYYVVCTCSFRSIARENRGGAERDLRSHYYDNLKRVCSQ